jgi:hypothetical protein
LLLLLRLLLLKCRRQQPHPHLLRAALLLLWQLQVPSAMAQQGWEHAPPFQEWRRWELHAPASAPVPQAVQVLLLWMLLLQERARVLQ